MPKAPLCKVELTASLLRDCLHIFLLFTIPSPRTARHLPLHKGGFEIVLLVKAKQFSWSSGRASPLPISPFVRRDTYPDGFVLLWSGRGRAPDRSREQFKRIAYKLSQSIHKPFSGKFLGVSDPSFKKGPTKFSPTSELLDATAKRGGGELGEADAMFFPCSVPIEDKGFRNFG